MDHERGDGRGAPLNKVDQTISKLVKVSSATAVKGAQVSLAVAAVLAILGFSFLTLVALVAAYVFFTVIAEHERVLVERSSRSGGF